MYKNHEWENGLGPRLLGVMLQRVMLCCVALCGGGCCGESGMPISRMGFGDARSRFKKKGPAVVDCRAFHDL